MARPTNPATTFLRDPAAGFRHDGFGHENSQDKPGDKCFRVIPHSGGDETGRGPIYSVAGGQVVASSVSTGAGWYVIEETQIVPGYGRVYPIYFHAAPRSTVPKDTWTEPGDQIAVIGDTGTGTSPGAYHLHFSVATSLKAALALVTVGNSPRRKNESVQQWADRMGLLDAIAFLKAVQNMKASAPAEPAPAPKPSRGATARRLAMVPTFHPLYLVMWPNGAARFYNGSDDERQVYEAMKSYWANFNFETMTANPGISWALGTVLRENLWAAQSVASGISNQTVEALKAQIAALPKANDVSPAVGMLDTGTALAAQA